MNCTELWEPDARPRDTHSCALPAGHLGPHHCPLCHSTWDEPGGTVTAPES